MASSRRCGTNESLTVMDSAGGYDYSTIQGWEEATDIDCVTGTVSPTMMVRKGNHSEGGAISFSGATTSATYYRKIRPWGHPPGCEPELSPGAPDWHGHFGHPASGVGACLQRGSAGNFLSIGESYFAIEDMLFQESYDWSTGANYIAVTGDYCRFVGCFWHQVKDTTATLVAVYPIGCTTDSLTLYVINCAFIDNAYALRCTKSGTTWYVYNCTMIGQDTNDVHGTAGVFYFKNCIYATRSASMTYNDTTNYTGSSYLLQINPTYPIPTRTDTVIYDQGTSLAADAAYAFDDDYQFQPRLKWSIGCSEGPMHSRVIGANETWHTYDSAGGSDYSVLDTWEAATDVDLVTGTVSYKLRVGNGNHDDELTAALGGTTSETYRRIIADNGRNHWHKSERGKIDNTAADLSCFASTNNAAHPLTIQEDWFSVQDIIVAPAYASAPSGNRYAFNVQAASGKKTIISNCAVVDFDLSPFSRLSIAFLGTGAGATLFVNCISVNSNYGIYASLTTGGTLSGYNCSFVGSTEYDAYISSGGAGCYLKNCVLPGSISGTWTETTNIKASTPLYKAAASYNYLLSEADTVAKDQGTALSADATFFFADDILGRFRGTAGFGSWDCGWHETSPKSSVSLDAYLKKSISVTTELDAYLKALAKTAETDIDAYLQKVFTAVADLDAYLHKAGMTATTDMDACLHKADLSIQADIDGYLQEEYTVQTDLDACVHKNDLTISTSLDAQLWYLLAVYTELDAYLHKNDLTTTADIDALLQKVDAVTAEIDAYLLAQFQVSADLDAVLQAAKQVTTQVDSYLKALDQAVTTSLDAYVHKNNFTITASIDALVSSLAKLKTVSLDGYIKKEGISLTASLDGWLIFAGFLTIGLDALLYAPWIETIDGFYETTRPVHIESEAPTMFESSKHAFFEAEKDQFFEGSKEGFIAKAEAFFETSKESFVSIASNKDFRSRREDEAMASPKAEWFSAPKMETAIIKQ